VSIYRRLLRGFTCPSLHLFGPSISILSHGMIQQPFTIYSERTEHIRYIACKLLLLYHYGNILYYFRDKVKYWSKIVTFSHPLAFSFAAYSAGALLCHSASSVIPDSGLPSGSHEAKVQWAQARCASIARSQVWLGLPFCPSSRAVLGQHLV